MDDPDGEFKESPVAAQDALWGAGIFKSHVQRAGAGGGGGGITKAKKDKSGPGQELLDDPSKGKRATKRII